MTMSQVLFDIYQAQCHLLLKHCVIISICTQMYATVMYATETALNMYKNSMFFVLDFFQALNEVVHKQKLLE